MNADDFLNQFRDGSEGKATISEADELCVHAILSGYHTPKFDEEKIIDMFISDAYAGYLQCLDHDEITLALKMIKNIIDHAKKKGLDI